MQFAAVPLRRVLVRCEVQIWDRIAAALSFFFYGFSQAFQEKWCVNTTTDLRPLPSKFLSGRHYTGCLQKNGAVSKINKKFIAHLTRAKRTPSAAATVQVSHALPAVRFSCLMRGRGASFQDGVAAGKGFLCAPF